MHLFNTTKILILVLFLFFSLSLYFSFEIFSNTHDDVSASTVFLSQKLQHSFTGNTTLMITKSKKDATYCLHHRGESGKWLLDWEYASQHQYKTFGMFPQTMIANQLFQPTFSQPYRLATAYRWQDDQCPITTIDLQRFCQVLKNLGITRVYTAGDSLTEAFTTSLRALLGYPKWGSIQFIKRRWSQACVTPHGDTWWVNHTYRRVQTPDTNFDEFFQQANLQDHRRDFITENPGRTAIVLNLGAHIHSLTNFTKSFDAMLHVLDEFQRPQDLIFFRNTAPGHSGCFPRESPRKANWSQHWGDRPYHSYQEYQRKQRNKTLYDWHLLESFNQYAHEQLEQRRMRLKQSNRERSAPLAANIYELNIFNSTLLRPDGHVGGEDCLHYSLPGPIDWWVHLWYSALLDLEAMQL